MPEPIDLGLVTNDEKTKERITQIAEEFQYDFKIWETLDELMDEGPDCSLVVCYIVGEKAKNPQQVVQQATEQMQSISFSCPNGPFIVAVFDRVLKKEDADFLRKSGASMVMASAEINETSKLDFVCSQVIKAKYYPIKVIDIEPDMEIPFDVYHLMPLRQKFLKIVKEGRPISEEQLKKYREAEELYIRRQDLKKFLEYTATMPAEGEHGQARRFRGQFLGLCDQFFNLTLVLSDRSETLSFEDGKKLLEQCKELGSKLIESFQSYEAAWEVVSNCAIGSFGSVERAPAIATYAGYFANQMKMENSGDILLAGLLAEAGILFLSPEIAKILREGDESKLNEEQLEDYRKYPKLTEQTIANRRLPIEPKVKETLMGVNERPDGKGFPLGLAGEKINMESQVLSFAKELDFKSLVRMGVEKKSRAVLKDEIIEEQLVNYGRYSPLFLQQFSKAFKKKEQKKAS